ncbi:MAG: choice-of-anchor B family protein [SAR202 cluster bacterium]|nr:choice-of-anchor B family protein [SAR202 cluster bacterium]
MVTRAFTFVASLLLLAPLPAQGDGVVLLSKVDTGADYNDIWGYTAPDGREYAIIGTTAGTYFYNATDPTAPYEVAYISGPTSMWRDMKTWSHYAYIVTEGGGGMQIVNLANPDNPVLVRTWGANKWGNAHNIAMDEAEGVAYVCGTNNGMLAIDLTQNPENPTHIGTYNREYVHDLHPKDGLAHLAEIYDGKYRIVPTANLNYPTLDSITTPGAFTHNTWANEDNTLCITTDEVGGGRIAMYDCSNTGNIQFLDDFTVNNNTIPHNAFIIGDYVYISWYTEGLVVVDMSDPNDLKKLASYDTSPYSPGSGYEGAWGCYPFSPSGVVYISDRGEGLHILRVEGPAMTMSHAQPLENTEDQNGPYQMNATVSALESSNPVASVKCLYRVDGGSWQSFDMAPGSASGEWVGAFPGQDAPATVGYYLLAEAADGSLEWLPDTTAPGDLTFDFIVGRLETVYFNDFEGAGDEGFTHGGTGQDDWQRGVPAGKSGTDSRHIGTSWYDPTQAFSGNNIWANDLGNGNYNGAYQPNVSNWLESPAIDCSQSTRTTLNFQRWLSVEGAPYDKARIRVNGNLVWENPNSFVGDFHTVDVGWNRHVIDISSIADGNSSVTVRFELETDNIMNLGGWGIDDLEILSIQDVPDVDTIALSGPTAPSAGTTATYVFSNGPPSGRWWFAYSPNANGSLIGGHAFDLSAPYSVAGQGNLDSTGAGSFAGNIPAGATGRTIFLEVAARKNSVLYDSNVLQVDIQ